jgi:alkylated DNA nucleotide flippase Atl1
VNEFADSPFEDATRADFVDHVLSVVAAIPPGRVMTYGEVAASLGSAGARAVGQVMARFGSDVPWWRVVRAGGWPPRGHEDRALVHYRAELTPLKGPRTNYRIDLAKARHRPRGDELPGDARPL